MISLKRYSAATSQGPYLQINEDDHHVDILNNLFLVFDGFGGSNVGDRSVSLLKENISKFYTQMSSDPDSTLPFFFGQRYLLEANVLINAIYNAHNILQKDNMPRELSQKGGASSICSCMSENIMTLISVGNCAALLMRNGHLEKLLIPDDMKYLSSESLSDNFHSVPMSAFGLYENLQLNVKELRITEGDKILFMTDGAYGRLKDEELTYLLMDSSLNLSHKIKKIFSMANGRGNLDNQTTIILEF